jgi:membrane protease subunit HflK
VRARISDLTERDHLGIVIDNCQVKSVAPRQLQDVFSRVTIAQQNQSKQINDANTYRDKTLLNAAAQASAITTEAATASTNYVVAIQADANAFTNSLPAFETNRYLFAQRKVAEMMTLVLTNVAEKKFLPTHADGKPIELRLMLNNEPPEQKSPPTSP